jgi:hypothetical protein
MGTIHNIMMGCIIIHNMVVEDEMGLNLEADFDQGERQPIEQPPLNFHDLNAGVRQIEDIEQHYILRNDIMQHLWQLRGDAM